MAKCRPHHWRMPRVGDTALVCEACGRELPFGEISPNMRASIVVAYDARCGVEAGAAFREAVDAAVEHLFPRAGVIDPLPKPGPLPKRERPPREPRLRIDTPLTGPLPKRESRFPKRPLPPREPPPPRADSPQGVVPHWREREEHKRKAREEHEAELRAAGPAPTAGLPAKPRGGSVSGNDEGVRE